MSTIMGASEDEDEKIRERDGPPPVVRRKPKRRLTTLDDSEDENENEDSEEFRLSEYEGLLFLLQACKFFRLSLNSEFFFTILLKIVVYFGRLFVSL